MDGHNKQSKIKAYINPDMVNHNFLADSWRLSGNGLPCHNIPKIHINPNFQRSASKNLALTSDNPRQSSSLVHINPNFLNNQMLHNNVWQKNKTDLSLISFKTMDQIGKIIKMQRKENFSTKEESINNEKQISKIVCDPGNSVANKPNLLTNGAKLKTSSYSWHNSEISKPSNISKKEHYYENGVKFVEKNNLYTKSNKPTKIFYKHQSTDYSSKNLMVLNNHFKYIREKKIGKHNQSLTNKILPCAKVTSPVYASRTKLINKKLINCAATIKSNSEVKNYTQKSKNLNLLKLKRLNGTKLSPTIKSAVSVKTKYKFSNKLLKTKSSLMQDKKFINTSAKFKLDKRKISVINGEPSSSSVRQHKIERLAPNSVKTRNNVWNQRHNFWTLTNFPAPLCLWKKKFVNTNLPSIVQCYPNRTVVKIGGILYKSSQSKLTRTKEKEKSVSSFKQQPKSSKTKLKGKKSRVVYVRGEKFILDERGKSLRRHPNQKNMCEEKQFKHIVNRVDLGGVTYLRKSNNILTRTNAHHARYVVNYAKQRSIALLSSIRKRNNMPCMIYSRFGKCTRHSRGLCSYNHDKKNVALCKKFLKNECNKSNCLLSHEAVQEKMPTCHFFLKGCCNNDNCTYLHVKVNSKAPICRDFVQGFCKAGKDCLQRHAYACPEYDKTGKCSKGDKCLYPHKSKSKTELKKNNIWTKNKIKKNIAQKNKSKLLEVKEKDGTCVIIKKPERSFLKSKSNNGFGRRRNNKNVDFSDSSNSTDPGTTENIEFIPKRVKLDNLPCFIPLGSSTES